MLPQLAGRVVVNAVSKTAAATASGIIDRLLPHGAMADWVMVDIIAATADVVSNKPTVLKLQQADTTDATNFGDISGFVGGTDFVIPNANTAATAVLQNHYRMNVDCRGKKRYLQPVISPATTQVITILASLGQAGEAPRTAAKANTMVLVEG